MALQESLFEAGDLSFITAGSFDFAGAVDIGSTLLLPKAWAERLESGIASRLANAAAERAAREAMERAARGLRRFLPGAAEDSMAGDTITGDTTVTDTAADTTGAVVPPDSLGSAADSARSRIAEELKRRLRIPDR